MSPVNQYAFKSLDQDGKARQGIVEAATSREAYRKLTKSHAAVLSVKPAGRIERAVALLHTDIGGRQALPLPQQVFLARSLATLLSAGMALDEALDVLEKGQASRKGRRVIARLTRGVRNGLRLSDAIAETNLRFDATLTGLLQAGEESGRIAQCLTAAADALEKKSKTRKSITNALIYPVILLITSIIAFGFLFAVVIPRLKSLIAETGNDLPALTSALLTISEIVQASMPIGIPVTIVGIVALILFGLTPQGRLTLHQIAIRIPGIGGLLRNAETALIFRMIGFGFEVGMEASSALAVAARGAALEPYKRLLANAVSEVRQGTRISDTFSKAPRLVPAYLVQIVGVGERSASMAKSSSHIADLLDEELATARARILSLITPVFLLFFGGLTALVMFAVWSSVLSLNTTILN